MNLLDIIEKNIFQYALQFVIAVALLFIGFQFINLIVHLIDSTLKKSKVDKSIQPFIISILSIGLKILLILTVAGTLGIKTTSFVALLASAGLAFGLALQGSLANFAGGVLILLFKPFEKDDYIDAQNIEGTVDEVQLFFTKLIKLNGETVYIPNGTLANGNITNFTRQGKLRLNIAFGVSYSADLNIVRNKVEDIMRDNHLVMQSPSADVIVVELGDNSVNMLARPWVLPQHKPSVTAQIIEEIKKQFDENRIEIPFPQTVIHLKK